MLKVAEPLQIISEDSQILDRDSKP